MSNWAKISATNVILNVEMTDEIWVENFVKENPDVTFKYIKELMIKLIINLLPQSLLITGY